MQDARYLRDQAKFCLEIARQVSDREMAENLRAEAALYVKRASQAEQETGHPSNEEGKPGGNGV